MAGLKRKAFVFLTLLKLLAAAVIVRLFRRDLLRKNLWLIQEKRTEARDNGYHLYVYVREKHPEIPAYYAIVKGAPDEEKIKKYGAPIQADSMQHYFYWIAAKYSINSQPNGASPYPLDVTYRFRKLCRKDQKVVYLKHGVDKDELPHILDYSKTRFDLVSFVSKREQEFIQEYFGYPDAVAQLLGFCRYDRLADVAPPRRQILVMPTFRKWLRVQDTETEATEAECMRFRESDFYRNYSALLSDERLLAAAKARGYKIVFYLHYAIQPYTKVFQPLANETVIVADRQHYDVQGLMLESAAMVTDFSSVFFDFAYMKKPEVFFQFDEEKYRQSHYKPGYFDYRRDGFGPVCTQLDDTVDELLHLMENGCQMPPEYLRRVSDFFAFFDDHNCERTYRAIQNLG